MTEYEIQKERELFDDRNYLVSKSNEIIFKSRYNLTPQEQKIILYVIHKIKPDDTDFEAYEFSLKDLCRVCGITQSGQNYRNFKKSIEGLGKKVLWVETEKTETMCHWVNEVEIDKDGLTVRITLSKALKPYLLKLRENFTSYELENVLPMRSKYSIRIYEMVKANAYKGFFDIELEDLRARLECNYARFDNFRAKVLDTAVEEINLYTDLEISFEPMRKVRKITGIHFEIKVKDGWGYSYASLRRGALLNGRELPENTNL